MMIDLHVHSLYSDGELSPLEILDVCNKSGVSIVSITDHNNIIGSKKAIYENPYPNLTIIPGIELDAQYTGGSLHILGYNMNFENSTLNCVIKNYMEDSVRRIKSLLSELKKTYNISFKDEDIQEVFNLVGNIGRPEIAKLCVKYGYCKTIHDAFELYFEPVRCKLEKKKHELSASECIKCISDAGGIASIAHPITLNKDITELKAYFKQLIPSGLVCVEVYHSTHSEEFTSNLNTITNELGLYQSGGSDFHGPIVKPEILLGSGENGNLNISSLSILSKITRC